MTGTRPPRTATPSGVALTKISAGSQGVAPLAPSVDGLPIAVLPIEDGVVLRQGASHRIIPVGHLLLLPRNGDWNVVFQRDMRAIVLSVTSEATHGRIAGKSRFGEARVVAPGGLAGVVSGMLDATARTLETLVDAEWGAVAQSLVDLLMTSAHQHAAPVSDAGHTATQAAIQHRICQTIERRLDDPELSPARVAQMEGISERYLQKLFEGVGDNFTQYVRERRLQRAWTDLSNPAEVHRSISEIAYRYGFSEFRAFQPDFPASLWTAATRVSPTGGRACSAAVELDRATRLAASRAGPVARPPAVRCHEADRCCRQSGNRGSQEGG